MYTKYHVEQMMHSQCLSTRAAPLCKRDQELVLGTCLHSTVICKAVLQFPVCSTHIVALLSEVETGRPAATTEKGNRRPLATQFDSEVRAPHYKICALLGMPQ